MDKARETDVSQAGYHSVVASIALTGVQRSRNTSRSALFLFQRKQQKDDAERRRNRGGNEACARDFNARMKTFFQLSGKADQEKKKSKVE